MPICCECDAEIDVDEFDVDRGDELSCPDCGANLVVTALSPIELQLADDDPADDEEDEASDEADDDWE